MDLSARDIGRVGGLAIALGIGSAIAATPVACADNAGPPGAGSAASTRSGSPGPSADRKAGTAKCPTSTAAASRSRVRATSVAGAKAFGAVNNPLSDLVRTFIGDGDADHPDGGILVGNGYSWTAATCADPSGCTGGNGRVIGNGGNGFAGGDGGDAGWFGHGGDGGAALAGGAGGSGGRGGLFLGDGGSGGAGGVGAAGGPGGRGGEGGSAGALSIAGRGGDGGPGGTGGVGAAGPDYGSTGAPGGSGGTGGAGGNGGWILGFGGSGGAGGLGGAGGTGGLAGYGGIGGGGGSGGAGGAGRVLFLVENRPSGGVGGSGGSGGTGGGVDGGAGGSGASGGVDSADDGGIGGTGGQGGTPGGTVVFTALAQALIAFVNASRIDLSGTAASLLTPINYNADIFAAVPALMTGNYAFDGYLGVPGLDGTGEVDRQTAAFFNVAWETVDPDLNAAQRVYTSAASTDNAAAVYGVNLVLQDTIPLVFSNPVLPPNLDPTDFLVTLNDDRR